MRDLKFEPPIEVLSAADGVRRRHWNDADKVRIVEESFSAGVTVTDVARRNGVPASLVFTWRRQAKLGQLGGGSPAPLLLPVELAPVVTDVPPTSASEVACTEPARRSRRLSGIIEIALGSGRRLRVDRDVDADALRRVLDVLDRR